MRLIILTLMITTFLFSSSIEFEKSLDIAKKRAIQENKKLMIMYSTPTCPECNYMKKKVFKNKDLASYINANFVSVVMDIKDDKEILPFSFIGIPTFYFAKAEDMTLISKKIGGSRESEFLEIVKSIK